MHALEGVYLMICEAYSSLMNIYSSPIIWYFEVCMYMLRQNESATRRTRRYATNVRSNSVKPNDTWAPSVRSTMFGPDMMRAGSTKTRKTFLFKHFHPGFWELEYVFFCRVALHHDTNKSRSGIFYCFHASGVFYVLLGDFSPTLSPDDSWFNKKGKKTTFTFVGIVMNNPAKPGCRSDFQEEHFSR